MVCQKRQHQTHERISYKRRIKMDTHSRLSSIYRSMKIGVIMLKASIINGMGEGESLFVPNG